MILIRLLPFLGMLVFFFSATSPARADLSFSAFVKKQQKDVVLCGTAPATVLSCTLREDALLASLRGQQSLTIHDVPLDPSTVGTIRIQRVRSVVDQNTTYRVSSESERALAAPEMHAFSGIIDGEVGSTVRLIDVGGNLFLLVERSTGKSFILAPTAESIHDAHYTLMASSAIHAELRDIWNQVTTINAAQKTLPHPQALDWTRLLEVDLALETDTEFFISTGRDVRLAQAYATALVQMVSMIYTEQVNICFRLSWLKTWTASPADPYDVKGDAYALPEKVRSYWSENYRDVPRDVAHVMTSISYGGGGFGFFNALCSSGEYAFSVSSVQGRSTYPTFAFTYDAYILAHELGHNFNATHTHSCAAGVPLDTCVVEDAIRDGCLDAGIQAKPNPGSIMSYCGGTNNAAGLGYTVRMEFLEFNKQEIRTAAEAATCLEEPAEPTLALTSLRGGEQLRPAQQVAISWRSARVANVRIDYTVDGSSWASIVTSVPAADGSYTWTVADVCTNDLRIRLKDADGGEASDTSVLATAVLKDDPDGLVAYYPFAESLDDEQECHLYNLSGAATYVNDRSGAERKAVTFNGATSLRNNDVPMDFDSFTYTFWFLPSSLDGEQQLLGTSWEEQQSIIQAHVWGQFGIAYWSGGGAPAQIWGGTPTLNTWNHGAVTSNGSTISLYMNGLLRAEEPLTNPLNKRESATLFVGGRAGTAFFRGAMDEIRYYRRSLSASEIAEMYTTEPVSVAERELTPSTTVVYPNPAREQITIVISDAAGQTAVQIVDALGVAVWSGNVMPNTTSVTVDVQPFPAGVYQVVVSCDRMTERRGIVIMR